MSQAKLDLRLLKAVSRSFYLSVRVLPAAVRGPIGIAYLLARASDTIADTASVPVETRLQRLAEFQLVVEGESASLDAIQRDIQPSHTGERALLQALPRVLAEVSKISAWDRSQMRGLLAKIIRGQSNDLRKFSSTSEVTALANAEELEEYTHLVAGCVGEWWTRICFHHLPEYALVPENDLIPLGDGLGRALQLVNILRDLPADLSAGRCYLPADELAAHGLTPREVLSSPSAAQPVIDTWTHRARTLLDQARLYITSVRVRRIQLACFLPWRLAGQTLDLLEKQSPLASRDKIKVPRSAVRAALWEGVKVALLRKPIR